MSLNGGYAMIKYNSTQEELQIAYKSKRPALFYDENQRAHWAVIEETATQSVDEETQEPITIYEYSYKLLDEANDVVANPTLSGDEATLNGLEVDGTKYKVGGSGGKLYLHNIRLMKSSVLLPSGFVLGKRMYLYYSIVTSSNEPITFDTFMKYLKLEDYGDHFGNNIAGDITISDNLRAVLSFSSYSSKNMAEISYIGENAVLIYEYVMFNSVDFYYDTITEV